MTLNHTVLQVLMVNWWLLQHNNLFPLIWWIRLDSVNAVVLSVLSVCDGSAVHVLFGKILL